MNAPSDDDLETALAEVLGLFSSLPSHLLRQFVDEILRWNPQLGLVSKKNPVAACKRLLIESVEFGGVVAKVLAPALATRVADVGSGGGFPGVVWHFLYPDWDLVLIERREKKAIFLSQLVKRLDLRIEVISADARDASHVERHRHAYDLVATMAVGDPLRTAPLVEELLGPVGLFATTLPADAVAPARCGADLVLQSETRLQFGRYALYRKRV
jgi:16S rRNA (guanine(527)-N(7))-methyltransferase RsmG